MNTFHYKGSGERDYVAISDHGLIGNLRTAALVSLDGSIESYCIPNFDSPSVFARILDKDKGGHFSISPPVPFTTKQNYLPSSNVLQTKFLNDEGVISVTDFLPRNPSAAAHKPLLHWLIRRVEVIRGKLPLRVECAPAFDYARVPHHTSIVDDHSIPCGGNDGAPKQQKALFESDSLSLDLRFVAESTVENVPVPDVELQLLDLAKRGHKGPAISVDLALEEGQAVTFILRTAPEANGNEAKLRPSEARAQALGVPLEKLIIGASSLREKDDPLLTKDLIHELLLGTNRYWNAWIRRSTYNGSWKEAVHRSALALKLLIYEPTGAIVASPTFSLPEFIGGTRNWDYRASWIRDSSFTLYALIRLGFTHEANSYMDFIFERLKDKNPDGSLQIMYTIHGGKIFPEEELMHLDGHKGSKPVRIGNGAIDHIQLDIYGELLDCIYLGQKFGRPLSYDTWVAVRELVDFVVAHYNDTDLSIWEVRNRERHFTYSKVMMWVAIDRGLRLADKRSLPCPRRLKWLEARDDLYEQVMNYAWNPEMQIFGQSYEATHVLDSSVLIMPLVFFATASDPRFLSTLNAVLKTPERGGLMANNLVYRYNTQESDDGVGGEEGTFCLCTLWCIEALTRAGEYDKAMLTKAVSMFEDFLLYTNHVGLCTEEISASGEGLGNAVQGFTHVTLISAAFNLSRTLQKVK
ncbi:glycoside hydrolase family 15 protein [Heterobasidion irregulare TC 32-1]|uniref:Glycoside hydrolase family 15 protein n=1 Tax=Heterobasidion irregulare (strain TC 32-1) TaxID=747525 RepID=W4KNX5_HETIT|nr:glycoside hydrolase family 15 protein [Heterobasidion irregulare TC 32-1]ETW87512.1 glycoside hydrolase family 15 protein [Heterobasidion irregulare TC 32-1]